MPYSTLADLHAAVQRGELRSPLMLDNDNASVYDGDQCVFAMHPATLLLEALDLLGIQHEGV